MRCQPAPHLRPSGPTRPIRWRHQSTETVCTRCSRTRSEPLRPAAGWARSSTGQQTDRLPGAREKVKACSQHALQNHRQATKVCPPHPGPSDQSTGAQLPTSASTTGLVQQTDQIAASRDLSLLVRPAIHLRLRHTRNRSKTPDLHKLGTFQHHTLLRGIGLL